MNGQAPCGGRSVHASSSRRLRCCSATGSSAPRSRSSTARRRTRTRRSPAAGSARRRRATATRERLRRRLALDARDARAGDRPDSFSASTTARARTARAPPTRFSRRSRARRRPTYTDASRGTSANDGNWFCYQLVSTSATSWTAPLPFAAMQLGLVTTAVADHERRNREPHRKGRHDQADLQSANEPRHGQHQGMRLHHRSDPPRRHARREQLRNGLGRVHGRQN